jgi:hypothetical protein
MPEGFDLAVLFTAAGAFSGGALVKFILSAGKGWGIVPEHGRGILYANALVSAFLIGLGLLQVPWLGGDDIGQDILNIVLAYLGVYSSAIGVHETVAKVQRIGEKKTDPTGPDNR